MTHLDYNNFNVLTKINTEYNLPVGTTGYNLLAIHSSCINTTFIYTTATDENKIHNIKIKIFKIYL